MKVVMKAVTIIVVSLLVVALLFIAGSQNAYAAGKCTEGNFRCSAEYPTTVKPVKPSDARQDDSDLCLNERGVAFYGISTVNGRTISGIFTNSKDGNANTPANFVFCAAGDYPSRVRNSDGTYRDGNENSRGGYRCCPTGTSAIDDGGILCCPPGTVRTNGDNGRARPSWTNDDGGSWDRQLDSASDGDDFCFNRAGETLYITIADGEYSGIGDYNLLEKYDYRAEFNFNLHAGRVSQTSDPAFGVAELRCSDEYACQISEEGSPVSVGSICSDDDGEYCFEEGDELGEGDDRKICNALCRQ